MILKHVIVCVLHHVWSLKRVSVPDLHFKGCCIDLFCKNEALQWHGFSRTISAEEKKHYNGVHEHCGLHLH